MGQAGILPSLDKEAVVFEQLAGKGLGKVVGELVVGVDLVNHEFIGNIPEPVPFIEKIAGAVGDSVIDSQEVGALVIFKHSRTNG